MGILSFDHDPQPGGSSHVGHVAATDGTRTYTGKHDELDAAREDSVPEYQHGSEHEPGAHCKEYPLFMRKQQWSNYYNGFT